jgi:hypothetical protein
VDEGKEMNSPYSSQSISLRPVRYVWNMFEGLSSLDDEIDRYVIIRKLLYWKYQPLYLVFLSTHTRIFLQ